MQVKLFFVILLSLLASCGSQESPNGIMVYITASGSKYHLSSCRYLAQTCVPVSVEEAISRGYDPCSDCKPPVLKSELQPQSVNVANVNDNDPESETTQTTTKVQCSGITKKGKRCKRKVSESEGRCFQHKSQ